MMMGRGVDQPVERALLVPSSETGPSPVTRGTVVPVRPAPIVLLATGPCSECQEPDTVGDMGFCERCGTDAHRDCLRQCAYCTEHLCGECFGGTLRVSVCDQCRYRHPSATFPRD